ncbi:MAG TPA: universal stress protein [Syntrophomonadaceae bacterium]|jgi:nucleotide-binding universal stress UspA family protein|nr:universal stress protein [Syntrophomonadaceae bacterium]HRX21368.1 universal stress protein [Syntrophomonadaceae bacterium]
MFKNILVPVDGSDQSLHSAEIAVELAAEHGGKIHLLHIIRPSDYSFTGIDILDLVQKSAGEIVKHTEASLKDMAEKGNVTITSEVTMGNPASVIVERSKQGYDAIVIASRGLSGLSEILLGSVSNVVSHHAHCPVLLIRN